MKTLYTQRWDNGSLMKFDGGTWSTIANTTVTNWPVTGQNWQTTNARNYGCFVYEGKLHRRYRTYITNSTKKVIVDTYNPANGTITQQFALDTTSNGNTNEYWGNTFEYKGRVYWFAQPNFTSNTNETDDRKYWNLYCFYYDGSGTPQLVRRRTDEMGQFTIVDGNSYALNGSTTEGIHNESSPTRVMAHQDRMYLANQGGLGPSNYGGLSINLSTYMAALDIDTSTNQVTTQQFAMPTAGDKIINLRSYPTYTTINDDKHWANKSNMENFYMATCSWKNRVYGITLNGQLWSINPTDSTRTMVYDIPMSHDEFLMKNISTGATTFTTTVKRNDSGNDIYSLAWSETTTTSSRGNGPWIRNACSSRFVVKNYGGVANSNVVCYGQATGNENGDTILHRADNDAVVPNQNVGTQFEVRWGMVPSLNNGNYHYTAENHCHMFIYNDKLHILMCHSRRLQDTGGTITGDTIKPWYLCVWDGTNPMTITKYLFNNNSYFTHNGLSFAMDEAGALLHVFSLDTLATVIRHTQILLASPYTMTQVGTVYSKPNTDQTNDFGIPQDAFCAFDPGDVTVTISGRTLDPDNAKITINYSLWGVNSDTATVSIQYFAGSNWIDCTQKAGQGEGKTGLASSASGTAHTFVHDVGADLGASFVGSIQHRVTAISQTRN